MERILIGSRAFFDGIPGFMPHDTDYLSFSDEDGRYPHHERGVQVFRIVHKEREEILAWLMKHRMLQGALFVPEVAKMLKLTIDDILPLRSSFRGKWRYYQVIYDAYVENNAFVLNDKQRAEAYRVYKEERDKFKIKK